MMKLNEMSATERSLLLYVESVSTEYAGLVDASHINADDIEILKRWDKDGFISYSRITYRSLQTLVNKHKTSIVALSESAWLLAHEERRARNLRMKSKAPYKDLITTKTKNAAFVEGA